MNDDRRLNGVAPQNKAGNVPASADGKLRTPTIYEALPYTPLSSIVPFTPGMSALICYGQLSTSRFTPLREAFLKE